VNDLELQTQRLTLLAMTAELVDALREDRPSAEALVNAEIPPGFPDAELGGYLPVYGERLRADPSALGFGPWLAVSRDERVVSRCESANEPSVRVLEKAGFVRCGEADGMLLWEWDPEASGL